MEEQDRLEKLKNITKEYSPDPDLANRVIEQINQKESTVAFKKPVPQWLWLAVLGAVCVIFLAVFLPVYLKFRTPQYILYTDDNITFERVEDVSAFLNENNLELKYYESETALNQYAKIIESNNLAYFMQDLVSFEDSGLDKINLKIILIENAKFEFSENYIDLSQSKTILNIEVNYSIENNISNQVTYKASFNYEGKLYLINIESIENDVSILEKHINTLLN